MSEVSMVRRRRRLASPVLPVPAPAAPLEDDDLLLEVLLRLPPQPSSLLRASVVCKRWRRLVSDPGFLRRFRTHHRKPPLLGFFSFHEYAGYRFTPTQDPPDRIPAPRFSLTQRPGERLRLVDCRHGLALFLNRNRPEALVWNPISGQQRRVSVPPEFDTARRNGVLEAAVLCAAGDGDHGHVHGDCDLSSFKLALVCIGDGNTRAFACLYKSKPGEWGDVISKAFTRGLINSSKPGVLVGNAFCWLLSGASRGGILRFDFDMQKLVVVRKPVDHYSSPFQIMQTEDGSLGLIVVTELSMHFWQRKVNSNDAARWVLKNTIELDKHLSPRPDTWTSIQGYDEDNNVIFLRTSISLFMIQLDSMRYKEIPRSKFSTTYFPYTSFCAADWATGARDDDPQMSSSTLPD